MLITARYHTKILPGRNQTQGITHAIMAFAPSTLFNSDSPKAFIPFEPVSSMRKRFSKDTEVTIAIGAWGDTSGFSEGAKDEKSRNRYAKNVAAMLESTGFDGVGMLPYHSLHGRTSGADDIDIDWEYPGGNGADYKQVPNSKKTWEIEAYPHFVEAIRKAIGKDKALSIAVPGKKVDMIAFTEEQGPKIWPSVDFVDVMSYDLMNRRDNVTKHQSSVEGSLDTINNYSDIGLDADKMNLGFAYYAKWFTTDPKSDCDKDPIGCAVVPLENPDGSDNGKSGVVTFEKGNMGMPPKNLPVSTDGKCGVDAGKCPKGQCCSRYGNW